MLDFIFSAKKMLDRPYLIIFEAIYLVIISVFISLLLLPPQYVSIGILTFITVGAIPLFNKIFSYSSYLFNYNKSFFTRHKKLLIILVYFFIGLFIAYSAFYFFSTEPVREAIFLIQNEEMEGISYLRSSLTGEISAIDSSTQAGFGKVFSLILKNNIGVAFRALLLSLFYGAGALFLIAWNASILATVISAEIFSSIVISGYGLGLLSPFIGLFNALFNLIGYIPHGLPEILTYFLISFAGAMIARDLNKGIFSTEYKFRVLLDFLLMVGLALLLLVLGALIEASYFL
jgi:hypothetical protein